MKIQGILIINSTIRIWSLGSLFYLDTQLKLLVRGCIKCAAAVLKLATGNTVFTVEKRVKVGPFYLTTRPIKNEHPNSDFASPTRLPHQATE